jgi:small conductance mechanosensitive channel
MNPLFSLGELTTTYSFVIIQVLVGLIITFIVARIVKTTLKRFFTQLSKKSHADVTQFIVLRRIVVALIYLFGIILTLSFIPGFENAWISFITGAGILAVVVGLAAQKTFGNIVAGLFIALFRPFRVGDRITVKGDYGIVEDITLMHTVIVTPNNIRMIVPNTVMSDETVINYSRGESDVMRSVEIGISYDSNIALARTIIQDEIEKHEKAMPARKQMDYINKNQQAVIRVTEMKDFSVNIRFNFWSDDYPTGVKTGYELLESIKKRFDTEGIEIPFPYRTIVYKKDLETKAKRK